jgi:glycosyltransferase involved in cell wall biosynthesis
VNERSNPASPVRVAHVVEALEVGGLEKLIVEFARHTDRARFTACVVTLGERGHLADEVEALGWPVHPLHARPGLKPRAVLRLAGLFRREAVDVVHTHSEGPLLYGTAAARLARVGRVIHTRHHGPDLGNPRHILALMALAARCVDRVVCVADDGARHARAEGVPAAKLVTVWNGIDLARFACRGPVSGGPAVAVGRLSPEKDHATLLHAVALAIRAEPAFRLEIAGGGPCAAELKDLAARLGLGDAVRFLGQVDDVPALLARAGLLVQPSLLEGIALTLLEAMARGLPVVATRVGGNPEVVVDGQTGRLVPPRAPAPLADAMLGLWRDPETSRHLGRAGRDRAERCFDVRRTVARYEQLYVGIDERPNDPHHDPHLTTPSTMELEIKS